MEDAPILAEDSLAYRVYRLARLLRVHFLSVAARQGSELTQEQWLVLNKLHQHGALSQTELADQAFADRPNLTRMLAILESRRLVSRGRDDDDARRLLVRLTARGRGAHDAFAAAVLDERRRIFDGIDEADLAVAGRVLARIEANVLRQG